MALELHSKHMLVFCWSCYLKYDINMILSNVFHCPHLQPKKALLLSSEEDTKDGAPEQGMEIMKGRGGEKAGLRSQQVSMRSVGNGGAFRQARVDFVT